MVGQVNLRAPQGAAPSEGAENLLWQQAAKTETGKNRAGAPSQAAISERQQPYPVHLESKDLNDVQKGRLHNQVLNEAPGAYQAYQDLLAKPFDPDVQKKFLEYGSGGVAYYLSRFLDEGKQADLERLAELSASLPVDISRLPPAELTLSNAPGEGGDVQHSMFPNVGPGILGKPMLGMAMPALPTLLASAAPGQKPDATDKSNQATDNQWSAAYDAVQRQFYASVCGGSLGVLKGAVKFGIDTPEFAILLEKMGLKYGPITLAARMVSAEAKTARSLLVDRKLTGPDFSLPFGLDQRINSAANSLTTPLESAKRSVSHFGESAAGLFGEANKEKFLAADEGGQFWDEIIYPILIPLVKHLPTVPDSWIPSIRWFEPKEVPTVGEVPPTLPKGTTPEEVLPKAGEPRGVEGANVPPAIGGFSEMKALANELQTLGEELKYSTHPDVFRKIRALYDNVCMQLYLIKGTEIHSKLQSIYYGLRDAIQTYGTGTFHGFGMERLDSALALIKELPDTPEQIAVVEVATDASQIIRQLQDIFYKFSAYIEQAHRAGTKTVSLEDLKASVPQIRAAIAELEKENLFVTKIFRKNPDFIESFLVDLEESLSNLEKGVHPWESLSNISSSLSMIARNAKSSF